MMGQNSNKYKVVWVELPKIVWVEFRRVIGRVIFGRLGRVSRVILGVCIGIGSFYCKTYNKKVFA